LGRRYTWVQNASNLVLMRYRIVPAVIGAAVLAGLAGFAQMHRVSKPEQVVRAVGVYEWTGDLAKPKAMRFVPVSIFINGELADAGVYIARPVPFALETGNIYELDDAGQPKGSVALEYARHAQATDSEGDRLFEDGWLGYGKYQAPPPPAPVSKLKPSKTLPVLVTSGGNSDKGDSAAKQDSSAAKDSSKPESKPASEDPDRPTMRRHPDTTDSDSTASTGGSSGGSSKDDDADRPTLKRRSPEEMKKAQKQQDQPAVLSTGRSLNDDPDRPKLKHNAEAHEQGIGELRGIPADMHQMVAVSDAKDRSPHAFTRPWTDDTERALVLAKMQAFARTQLAAYKTPPTPAVLIASSGATSTGAAATPATQSAIAKAEEDPGVPKLKRGIPQQAKAPTQSASTQTTAKTSASSAAGKTTTAAKHAAKSSAPVQVSLLDEELRGYVLSYGGAPTFVYTAHTDGTGSALRYVTIVAQDNGVSNEGGLGELKLALANVTDEGHLDRTPRMRLIDVVDAEASNRASLLFELRAMRSRQFALYRVIAAKPEQIFVTGSTE
jgi:hypothetical protein